MKRRIAVVCALLAGRNTGMFTVDRSAFEYFERFAPDADISYFTLGDPQRAGFSPEELGFSYKNLKDSADDFLSSDLIVYWGDFVHARSYWDADLLGWLVGQGLATSHAEATELAYRLLLLEDAPDAILRRVVIFGGTIITNKANQLADPRYRSALDRLLALAGGVFFRDGISAAYAAQLRGELPTQGADCAILLPDQLSEQAKQRRIGVFFGRANWIAQALLFARLLALRTGYRPFWLPWFPSPKRHSFIARVFGFAAGRDMPAPNDLLRRVKSCDAIVTDTYHLCVNAWRLGVPAICVGKGAERNSNTLGDKKKEHLYALIGASDFYIFREDVMLSLGLGGAVARSAAALAERAAVDVVVENLKRHGETAQQRLETACRDVLSK